MRRWVTHPLDPLTADEFSTVAGILRRERGVGSAGWRFASIEMREPDKAELRAFDEHGTVPARRATVVCFQRAENATYKSRGVVDRGPRRVVRPRARRAVQLHRRRVRRVRSVVAHASRVCSPPSPSAASTDIDLVFFDTWTYGDAVAPAEFRDRRLGWSDTWLKDGPGMNPYAHLVSGLHCVIDLNAMEVLRVEDDVHVETPDVMGEYVPRARTGPDPCGIPARTAQAPAHHPARRPLLHPRRQSAAVAELVVADRLQLPRGHDAAHRAISGRRPRIVRWRTGCRSPRWWCPTATRPSTTTAAPHSTSGSGASAS